jgi:hypothetical protein
MSCVLALSFVSKIYKEKKGGIFFCFGSQHHIIMMMMMRCDAREGKKRGGCVKKEVKKVSLFLSLRGFCSIL